MRSTLLSVKKHLSWNCLRIECSDECDVMLYFLRFVGPLGHAVEICSMHKRHVDYALGVDLMLLRQGINLSNRRDAAAALQPLHRKDNLKK